MNKIHRVVWSDAQQTWIVAAETTASKGKPASQRKRLHTAVGIALMTASTLGQAAPPATNTLPTGGQVKSGTASISQSGSTMDINQSTGKAIINWNTFNIGSGATVNFHQPGKNSVTLNRVLGSDPSAIYGSLNANGQVFLVNPSGVLFGAGSRVDVGGLVATTMNIRDDDFLAGNYRFTRDGGSASVVNQGDLYGDYIALLAPEVRNEGIISARMGTVALAAGDAVTLNLTGNRLIDVQIDRASIDTLIENKHLVQAEEGTVILAAQSAGQLLGKVVNSGAIEANGVTTDGGKVRLSASSNIDHSGSINVDAGANGKGGEAIVIANLDNANSRTDVSGSISAKGGTQSGDGGFIETSASHLYITGTSHIDTRAPHGKTGQWLLDPQDFTVAASGGNITGAQLSSALNSSSVTIETNGAGASWTGGVQTGSAGNGDIIFNEAVYWTADNVLTLQADRNIVFNASVVADVLGGPSVPSIQMTYGMGTSVAGSAYTTASANWVTPFINDPVISMLIQDNTPATPVVTPVSILALHTGSPLDLYLGSEDSIFVNAVSGGSTYDGNNVPFLPTFSLDAPGASPIDIIPTNTIGTPTWNTTAIHANTYSGILYTGGLASDAYAGLTAGSAGATWTISAATLTPSLSNTGVTKVYDGTTDAPTGFSPTYSFTGLAAADASATVSLANSGTPGYTDKNVKGTGNSTISVSGLSITGISGGVAQLGDYTLGSNTTASGAASITKADLTLKGSRDYDGTTKTAGGTLKATGLNGDSFSVTGTGDDSNLSTRNVQTSSKLASVTGLQIGTATQGLADNYQLSTTNSQYSVSKKTITVELTGKFEKTADGETAFKFTDAISNHATVDSLSDGDKLSGLVVDFASNTPGTNIGITAKPKITRNGVDVTDNYDIKFSGTSTGTIIAAANAAVNQAQKMTWQEASKSVKDTIATQKRNLINYGNFWFYTESSVDVDAKKGLLDEVAYATARTVEMLLSNGWTAKDFKDQGVALDSLYAADGFSEQTTDESDSKTVYSLTGKSSKTTWSAKTQFTQKVKPPFTRQQLIDAGYKESEVNNYFSNPKTEIKGPTIESSSTMYN